ncbi:multicopper oxidase [Pleomassaria siparia CBS 279.74]|uniref:Multicopper oxidase n=1 Tax=Pleomassaria siparia CBS 279.74 TaxID=1314801 RepID=A0A6G1JUV0_9PLEO|nr:multicopper oxidase [Pleomassaria siparia CBS 279.74]
MKCTQARLRQYDFVITRESLRPDGVKTSMILVNGGFPGPTIEANLGDTFKIRVTNYIDDDQGTAIHWHGLFQKETPWMDGVPSVTFCPIAPGQEFTYEFTADRVGSSWWHSHYSAQTAGGLFGAIVIHGASPYTYDVDLGPVLIVGLSAIPYHMRQIALTNNNLINGKMDFNCSSIPAGGPSCTPNAGFSKFRFQSGKRHLIRLVNTGLEGLQHFTIDGHKFTVVGLDYTPIQPYEADMISLTPGQRADIVVYANAKPDSSFWMRSDVDPTCSASSQPHAKSIIHYETANEDSSPTSTKIPYTLTGDCVAQPLSKTRPLVAQPLAPLGPSFVQTLDYTLALNYTPMGAPQFLVNGRRFRANYSQSLLLLANDDGGSEDASAEYGILSNVWDFSYNKTLRMILNNFFVSPHPMHLHGHDFWILAQGRGVWDGTIQGNTSNLMRRDTHQMIGAGADGSPSYLVLEFTLDNPGVWAFHCHITQHLILGMYMNIIYGQDAIKKYKIPASIDATCVSWREFARGNPVEQPDSGL